jgi:hypothetical protein
VAEAFASPLPLPPVLVALPFVLDAEFSPVSSGTHWPATSPVASPPEPPVPPLSPPSELAEEPLLATSFEALLVSTLATDTAELPLFAPGK